MGRSRKRGRAREPSGDYQMRPVDFQTGEQPLNGDGKALVHRAYELFEFFRQRLEPEHREMTAARKARQLQQEDRSMTAPTSMTLNSCIDNVIADQVDNMPEAFLAPERADVANSAEAMTDIVSFVLYQVKWPKTYKKIMEDSAVAGTGIAQVIWNDALDDGKGMVDVISWHPEDFYPDPMYENIQDGRACFKATTTTVAWVQAHYPDAAAYVHADVIRSDDAESMMQDTPSGDHKVTLLEYWYRKYDADAKRERVHMAQLAGHALLYSTELGIGCDAEEYETGVYAHGMYPFVLFKYRDVWRKPFGTGLYRDYRSTQEAIDRYAKYIDDNARESSIQKHFIRRGSGIPVEDLADMSRTVFEWDGADIRQEMQTIQAAPLNGQVHQFMETLINAMKQDSGQNQFNRGEGGGGVIAASAISHLITQGGKITRWHAAGYMDEFREMVEQILWLLSEYIDEDRVFQITGGWDSEHGLDGKPITMKAPPKEGDALPKPAYSVRVEPQRTNGYWKDKFNEMVLKAYEFAAQSDTPIPPHVLISMLQGYPDKKRIVNMLEEVSQQQAQMAQLQAKNAQMAADIKNKDDLIRGLEGEATTQGGAGAINARQGGSGNVLEMLQNAATTTNA